MARGPPRCTARRTTSSTACSSPARVKWVRERAEVVFDEDGRAIEGIGTVQDITERKRAQEELLRINRAHRALEQLQRGA